MQLVTLFIIFQKLKTGRGFEGKNPGEVIEPGFFCFGRCRMQASTSQDVVREQCCKRYEYRDDTNYTPEGELRCVPSGSVGIIDGGNRTGNNSAEYIQPKTNPDDCTRTSSNCHVWLSHPSYSCCFINILMFWFSFHECSLIYEQNVNPTSLNRKL